MYVISPEIRHGFKICLASTYKGGFIKIFPYKMKKGLKTIVVYGIFITCQDYIMDGFPSGQRGQTVNLLSTTSKVRILPHPFAEKN